MNGLMMDQPLLVKSIVAHAEKVNPNVEIVSVTADNPRHRYTYKDAFTKARKLANVIDNWGLQQGDRIATLCWNDYRHLEAYFGICCSGYVIHTINPRLFPEQVEFIINHAEDQYVFLDRDFMPLVEGVADQCPGVKGWVVMTDEAHMPETKLDNVLCYESLIADASEDFEYPDLDENAACALCYTSGTTGNPKGVLYAHRSTILHTMATMMPDALGISSRDVILPIVPMFHVNAWGLPYSCPIAGAKIVFPGSKMGDGAELTKLINEEGVTFSAGVPTVWLALQAHLRETGATIDTLNRIVVGGAACPLSVMQEFDKYDVRSIVGWGMTEMSPLGTANHPTPEVLAMSEPEQDVVRLKGGRPIYGVEVKITDDDGKELPWDGVAFGSLKVRGPWICSNYFKLEDSDAHADEGWFETGDVATVDANGYVAITDRTKDVIKSGGEWISSIEVENAAVGHPQVAEAAVIGRFHPKWSERPLLIIVRGKGGDDLSAEDVLKFLEGKIAKWWMPDAVEFIDELPHTATGKIQKVKLREIFSDYEFSA
jgi:3-(methylthio)propionyl---CoA ligase